MKRLMIILFAFMCVAMASSPPTPIEPEFEDGNTTDSIELMNSQWEIVRKDTIGNEVYYTLLIGWFTNENQTDTFPVTIWKTYDELIKWGEGEKSIYNEKYHDIDNIEHTLIENLNQDEDWHFCITYIDYPWYPIDNAWKNK